MGKTKKPPRFWGKFLADLLITLGALGQAIYDFTKDPFIHILMFASVVILLPVILCVGFREYSLRSLFRFNLRKRGLLGFFLIAFSFFMTEWIWVRLCLILLGGGLMLDDSVPRRNHSDEKRGE